MASTQAAIMRAQGHTCEAKPDSTTVRLRKNPNAFQPTVPKWAKGTKYEADRKTDGLAAFVADGLERTGPAFASACKKCLSRKAKSIPLSAFAKRTYAEMKAELQRMIEARSPQEWREAYAWFDAFDAAEVAQKEAAA